MDEMKRRGGGGGGGGGGGALGWPKTEEVLETALKVYGESGCMGRTWESKSGLSLSGWSAAIV